MPFKPFPTSGRIRWERFQKWLKTSNRIMWTVFGIVAVAYLVAVIVIGVIEAQESRPGELVPRSIEVNLHGCWWINLCEMECNFMPFEEVELAAVELIGNSTNCQTRGTKLILGENIVYSLSVIPANFFVTTVKINELHIMCTNIGTIQRNAFASTTMGRLQTLTLERATFRLLSKSAFRGLSSLTTLTFINSSIEAYESGAFDTLAPTLSVLTLSQADPQLVILQAKLLTGSVTMSALHYCKFKYNMKNTITNETFVGVPMLTTLDLSSCQIETIGPNSFDLLTALVMVRLNDNKLKNLPVGFFDQLLPNLVLLVDLQSNAWVCDCNICYVKSILSNRFNFRGDNNVCPVPDKTQSYGEAEVCSDEKCYELLATTEPPPLTTLKPNEAYEVGRQECQQEDSSNVVEIVIIRKRSQVIQIEDNPDGSVTLRVKKKTFNNTLLVWFDTGDNHHFQGALTSDDFDCRLSQMSNNSLITRSIQLDSLKPNTPYTFCLIENDSREYVVSPFNCVSYSKYKKKEDDVWMLHSSRDLTIGMIAMSVVLLMMLGALFGYLLMRRHPAWLRGGRNVVFVRSASDGSVLNRKSSKNVDWNRRISEVSTISANSYACTSGPSRFEIVQRQLELERIKRGENQYYMETMANASAVSNVYESSSHTPSSEAPTRPASYSTILKVSTVHEQPEPENYYSNAELLFGKNHSSNKL